MEKIQALKVPRRFKENVELASLMVKSKPYHDNEELLTMCYRCSTTNPLLNNRLAHNTTTRQSPPAISGSK